MVVLASAICTKSGKVLLSRQFVEISKVRIEGLLAAFPKLMGTGKQHTFTETDSVRYLFQPLEQLYIVLLTNKASNILEDLETLHLLAKLVPEYCKSGLEENEVLKSAFDLIFAFDEVIALGYKEKVSLQQIKLFTTMESHDEERHRQELKAKMVEAKKLADNKRKQIEKQKMESASSMSGFGGGGRSMSGMGGGMGSMGGGGSSYASSGSESHQSYSYVAKEESKSRPVEAAPGKGMRLGSNKAKSNTSAAQVLKEENVPEEEVKAAPGLASSSTSGDHLSARSPIHVTIEEKLVIQADNDGGLANMEVKGDLLVEISDPAFSFIKIRVDQGSNPGFQFKTHPMMNKDAYSSGILVPKDPQRAFQAGSISPVLKWRLVTKDESQCPLSISCWPSASNEGLTYVTIEYELKRDIQLNDVSIAIPIPAGTPVVAEVEDGNTEYNSREHTLYWKLPVVDKSNKAGSMEFSVPAASNSAFYPLHVNFKSSKTFCDIQVVDVQSGEDKPVKHSKETSLAVETFEITS